MPANLAGTKLPGLVLPLLLTLASSIVCHYMSARQSQPRRLRGTICYSAHNGDMLAGTLERARPGDRAQRMATLSVCMIRWKVRSPVCVNRGGLIAITHPRETWLSRNEVFALMI